MAPPLLLAAVLAWVPCLCAASPALTLAGSGTTNPSKLVWHALAALEERAPTPMHLSYRAVGSGTGQREFMEDVVDFASGDIPFSAEDFQELAPRGVLQVPYVLGSIGFFHSLPGVPESGRQALNMTRCLLARIFDGDITKWDHPDVLVHNPALPLYVPPDEPIRVVHRSGGSSSTATASKYLAASRECPSGFEWTREPGKGPEAIGPETAWPAAGSDGMVSVLRDTPYAIGYLETGHGHRAGLAEVALEHPGGKFATSRDSDVPSTILTVQTPGIDGDWSGVDLVEASANAPPKAGPPTWPLTTLSYLYLDADQTGRAEDEAYKGALVLALAEFLISDEVQELATSRYGFQPVPAAMRKTASEDLRRLITLPDGIAPWTFENGMTRAVEGAGGNVFSSKRRGTTSLLDALEDRIAALEARLYGGEGSS